MLSSDMCKQGRRVSTDCIPPESIWMFKPEFWHSLCIVLAHFKLVAALVETRSLDSRKASQGNNFSNCNAGKMHGVASHLRCSDRVSYRNCRYAHSLGLLPANREAQCGQPFSATEPGVVMGLSLQQGDGRIQRKSIMETIFWGFSHWTQ